MTTEGLQSIRRIEELDDRARAAWRRIPVVEDEVRRARRPFFVEVAGTPKSGKTVAATRLALFLRRNDFVVRVISERASISPLRQKDQFLFNVWTLCSTLLEILEAREQADQIVIIDRGIFDALSWIEWLRSISRVSDADRARIDDFILVSAWRDLIDLVFVLSSEPSVAMEREFASQLTRQKGFNHERGYLSQLRAAVQETVEKRSTSS